MQADSIPSAEETAIASRPSAVRPGTPELEQLIAEIGAGAAERELQNESPFEAMEQVRSARLGAIRLPVADGGGGASIREFFETLIALAAADSTVAHILRTHYEFVEFQLMSSSLPWKDRLLRNAANGDIYGNAVSEIGTSRAVDSKGWLQSTISPTGDGDFVINGTKYYCTGTLFSDWIQVYATLADEELGVAVVPVDREGITLVDDWDGIGQRRTGSGTTHFENVTAHADEVFRASDDELFSMPYRPAFPQLYLTAVIAGILRTVRDDAVALIHGRKRTYDFALASRPADDAALQIIVGRIASIAFAAESMVLRAAEAIESAFTAAAAGEIDSGAAHLASLRSAEAKVLVDELATQAATSLFDVGGSSAVTQAKNLDRHWRNIRTLASHNPDIYKMRAVGDHYVNGTDLPLNSYF